MPYAAQSGAHMTENVGGLPDYPLLKPVFDVLYLDGRIRLGSGPPFAVEVDDPDGSFAELIKLLDGNRSVAELQQQLTPVLRPDEALDALWQLHSGGFLEDARQPLPPSLTSNDLARDAVNLNFFRTAVPPGVSCYAPQAALKQTRVLLLGLGGIGSNVCMALAELGIGYILAVDFDTVELSNLNRQVLYSTEVVGERKVDAAHRRIRSFNPDIEFESVHRQLSSVEDVRDVILQASPDYVFCLADKPNGYIDFWVNAACVASGIPYSAGGVSGFFGNAYTVLPGVGPCYQCRVDGEIAASPELNEPLAYMRQHNMSARTAALGPACMFVAYFLAYELLRYRFDFMGRVLASHRMLEIDFNTFAQRWHDFERRPDCSVCSPAPAVAG
jgi:molybdopterin/thiamine biosynthesis adenylyltransferase